MPRPLLPLLLLTTASSSGSAASVDILTQIYADGVFRSAVNLPASQLPRDSRGVQLKPDGYGGEWFLTLSGPKLVTGAHLSYAGSGTGFAGNSRAVAKLSARLGGTLAAGCFGLGAERLSALKTWVENQVRAGSSANLNTERSFGPLRVQVLAQHSDPGSAAPNALTEIDVILARSGTPGGAAWAASCRR